MGSTLALWPPWLGWVGRPLLGSGDRPEGQGYGNTAVWSLGICTSGSWPGWPGLALGSRAGVSAQACGGVCVTENKVAGPPGHLLAVRPHPGGPTGLRSTLLGCCGSTSLGHRFVVGAQDPDNSPMNRRGKSHPSSEAAKTKHSGFGRMTGFPPTFRLLDLSNF